MIRLQSCATRAPEDNPCMDVGAASSQCDEYGARIRLAGGIALRSGSRSFLPAVRC